jgi:hypothetical protein
MLHLVLSPSGHIGFLETRLGFYHYSDRVEILRYPQDVPEPFNQRLLEHAQRDRPVAVSVLWEEANPPLVAEISNRHGAILMPAIPKYSIPSRTPPEKE